MEVQNEEDDEMAVPLNTRIIHHHIPTSHNHDKVIPPYNPCPNYVTPSTFDHHSFKYKECMKNQAIGVGRSATDGCGEFLPNGEEGTIESLSCSACHCHRNFHRKESVADDNLPSSENYYRRHDGKFDPRMGRTVLFMEQQNKDLLERNAQAGTLVSSSRALAQIPHRTVPSESDEEHGGGGVASRPNQVGKKRFRTKFSQEQKDKMLEFAERVGWKIQKLEESVVQSFCQEVGVKRKVLRVWMHNNKHSFAKKINQPSDQS